MRCQIKYRFGRDREDGMVGNVSENIRRRALAAACAGILACLAAPAEAAYPDRPITLVVPFAPGGAQRLRAFLQLFGGNLAGADDVGTVDDFRRTATSASPAN